MNKSDFEIYKKSLNLKIEVDNSLRRISEKILLVNKLGGDAALGIVATLLFNLDLQIDQVITDNCKDE